MFWTEKTLSRDPTILPFVDAALVTEIFPEAAHGDEIGAAENLAAAPLLMNKACTHQRRQMMRMGGGGHLQTPLQVSDGQPLIPGPYQQADQPKPDGCAQGGQPVGHPLFNLMTR